MCFTNENKFLSGNHYCIKYCIKYFCVFCFDFLSKTWPYVLLEGVGPISILHVPEEFLLNASFSTLIGSRGVIGSTLIPFTVGSLLWY